MLRIFAKPGQPSTDGNRAGPESPGFLAQWKIEALAILTLALMVVYFLATSWRKWPDPIVDSGLQWYAFWRLSQRALLYHDLNWNYGPVSAYFNACLFKCFGPGMMVLVTANLVIYGSILSLAYVAFRKAWGRLAAFAAAAVFISVFSFSHLTAIANYNYATPYAHESTHGMLLILVTAFVAVRWCRKESQVFAFLLGLCGGMATVLKPEFMLAGGILGIAAIALRWVQRQRVGIAEFLLIAAGLVVPVLTFTIWFARVEAWKSAFIDANQAWWLVLAGGSEAGSIKQQLFTGFDHPWFFAMAELKSTLYAVIAIGAIWAAGWFANRPWPVLMKVVTVLAAGILAHYVGPEGGWFNIGQCFPGIILIILVVVILRLRRELKQSGNASESTLMALMLVLLAGAMLARMPLRARVYHFGFYQAALAGMVAAAFMVANIPRWTGAGKWGRCLATAGCILALTIGCISIAMKSHEIRAEQTQSVGTGRDHFYAFNDAVDETGSLVNWAVERLQSTPPQTTVLVLPAGAMINYLSRRIDPMSVYRTEEELLDRLRQTPPDYVVLITWDLGEAGVGRYGTPGNPGYNVVKWLAQNYKIDAARGGDPLVAKARKGALILRPKAVVGAEAAPSAPVK